MNNEYKNFYENHFTPQKYREYQEEFEKEAGKLYALSTGPYMLQKNIAARIQKEILPAFVKLLNSEEYKEQIYKRGWFLPASPVTQSDFFGSIDFHIHKEDVRLIELNFFLPGHIGLIELFPKLFSKHFEYEFDIFSNGFEQKLASFLIQRFQGKKIAMAVNRLGMSTHYFEHYKYIEKFLRKNGVDAKVVYAKDAKISPANKPMWEDEEFDGVFNIVIPRIWEHNPEEFESYTALFQATPQSFFPNPWCWTMGDKRFLTVLSDLKTGDYGLDEKDIGILKSVTLKTKRMHGFENVEDIYAYFSKTGDFVLKPIDNYHTQGVYIRPTHSEVVEIFKTQKERYVVQEIFFAEDIYYEDENAKRITPWFSQLRTEFFNGEFLNFRAYGYSDPFGLSPMMPVAVR
jgi:hypothetical protein